MNDIVFALTVIPFIVFIWGFMFFIFDDAILNGYIKKKLQKRFPTE